MSRWPHPPGPTRDRHDHRPLQAAAPVQPPQRIVNDTGVFAVGQRVTPAGVQSVFTGRVAGVRFGSDANEIWAVAPGNTWRIAWRDNRVLTHAGFDGRPGVHGLVIDPVTRRRSRVVGRPLARRRGRRVAHRVARRSHGPRRWRSWSPIAPTRMRVHRVEVRPARRLHGRWTGRRRTRRHRRTSRGRVATAGRRQARRARRRQRRALAHRAAWRAAHRGRDFRRRRTWRG